MNGWAPPQHLRHREALVARAAAPDLAGRVRFLGQREDVPQLMAASAIHCVPSRPEQREAFGIVVIEAKQAGIPSVVTPSGALPELIAHEDDGWVCRDFSADALADGIEFFLDADHQRQGMASARRSAARYGRDQFEQAWTSVFAEVS
jgi:glycosyltransferase involved in cell wall biosynthesis